MPAIDVFFFDAGGGHRSVAAAIEAHMAVHAPDWQVRLVNLSEILTPIDPTDKLFGWGIQEIYNSILRHGWNRAIALLMPPFHGLVGLMCRRLAEPVKLFLRQSRPDLVLSVVPHLNRSLQNGVKEALPGCPFVVLMTDLADCPPHFWIEQQEQFLICPTDWAVRQALEMGIPKDHVFRTHGIVVNPAYEEVGNIGVAAERRAIGLAGDRCTGLVQFGAVGSRTMLDVAADLLAPPRRVQYIFVAGRSESVRVELAKRAAQAGGCVVTGFTTDYPRYLAISDFLLGKAGGVSVSEAAAIGVPSFVESSRATMPHERANAGWIVENRVGATVHGWRGVLSATNALLDASGLEYYRANLRRHTNSAGRELPQILAAILERRSGMGPGVLSGGWIRG